MPVVLKSPADLERMRAAGAVVASVHERLRGLVQPGITTRELDAVAYEMITRGWRFTVVPELSWLSGQHLRLGQRRDPARHSG